MTILDYLDKWFRAIVIHQILKETHLIQFTTKNGPQIHLDVSYANKTFLKHITPKFLDYL
jgi:hypothetical protein